MDLKGLDVSVYNGVIDWSKVGKACPDFVMVRASYGKRGRDAKFKKNASGAAAAGLAVGAYHYSYAENVSDAEAEAKNFLAAIKGAKLTYPAVLDLELNSHTQKALGHWTDMAVAFLKALERAGYFAMLYSDKYSLEARFSAKGIAPYAVWVAQWGKANTYGGPYGIWQRSSTGAVPGIKGPVDLDTGYVDYAKIIKRAGLNQG